eukprot:CAMPEP_0206303156 /NCGR_PEP_ID=MMETSP0106_2-20121207/9091_1 /ASSEMBLY_ACC=CAM_ASM_000206 /TAXON_ID=81532 /ORGANISM="Acanthoeca-like sp., Strain 10tr" /LENGTH=258 /DNA_ID=CAMNT_0053733941 /DNA_START=401 /DNA_END=1173 /DNA_ORIENTATION=+
MSFDTLSLGGGSSPLASSKMSQRSASYEEVRSESRSWDVTGVSKDAANGHEYELLAEGECGEFLIKTAAGRFGPGKEGFELVIKTTELNMPELNPEEQLMRIGLSLADGLYRLDKSEATFPSLESLVKFYARKSRPPLGIELQLSGNFMTMRRQRSPENIKREATLKRIRPISLAAAEAEESMELLRSCLPSANPTEDDDPLQTPEDTYETEGDMIDRARNSRRGSTVSAGLKLAAELDNILDARDKLVALVEGEDEG